ncbi:MAG: DUF2130 domain-containing protein [Clostridia bacterium]|nr:DUF2130 domain-containing protein [Clostridia bacterium]
MDIICPKCGQVFKIDGSGYAQIVQQVRDHEFDEELERRKRAMEREKDDALKIDRMEQEKLRSAELAKKDGELAEKKQEIERLKAQLDKTEAEKKLAVSEAVRETDKHLSEQGAEISKLRGDLELQKKENELRENSLIEQYKGEIRLREEEIERLKDFKARQSTKMVGESLEQHCMTQFNQIRTTAFPNAYFEKDNDAKTGSKGDFIYRESSDGTEFISIMFEMKNEMDTTATKHKNEDFFKELDKDRNEKKCEYAVLVSLLENDNEFYNNGIVDVSYRYPKMFVIRPQFFIPIISLLRNAALNSLRYQRELQLVRSQQLDLRNFESEMMSFKEAFSRNYDIASRKFRTAIEEIDKTIDHLQKTKDALLSSENQLRLANNKAEDLSIKKLTKNAPSVREMFEEISSEE